MCVPAGDASVARYVRTNIVIDEGLVRKVMDLYDIRTKREAIDFALREAARVEERRKETLALEGIGWDGDLDEIKRSRIAEP
jgi:Arc/MetJ family transcription regulator